MARLPEVPKRHSGRRAASISFVGGVSSCWRSRLWQCAIHRTWFNGRPSSVDDTQVAEAPARVNKTTLASSFSAYEAAPPQLDTGGIYRDGGFTSDIIGIGCMYPEDIAGMPILLLCLICITRLCICLESMLPDHALRQGETRCSSSSHV